MKYVSKIQEFIKKDIEKHPELKKEYERVSLNLDASVLARDICEQLRIKRKEFSKHVDKL